MKAETLALARGETGLATRARLTDADAVLFFQSPDLPDPGAYLSELRQTYPKAWLLGCTTGGEISGTRALQDGAVCAALRFDSTRVKPAVSHLLQFNSARLIGQDIGRQLMAPDLKLVFVLSDGLQINGSDLVAGITDVVGHGVLLTGGLAGDGERFGTTAVGLNALPQSGIVAALGFYGDRLEATAGSYGGWLDQGHVYQITRSEGACLYELDGRPALDVYRLHMGEHARNLPSSGLLFPLGVSPPLEPSHAFVRTLVGFDEKSKSLTFAGDLPQGYHARIMRGDQNTLVNGASWAATCALENHTLPANPEESIALLVSCIGRNLLMGNEINRELEAVSQKLPGVPLAGFYSYGEISPHPESQRCGLHNQTMTITLLSERKAA